MFEQKEAKETKNSVRFQLKAAEALLKLFLHGWHSVPGGDKPTYLKDHGHEAGCRQRL